MKNSFTTFLITGSVACSLLGVIACGKPRHRDVRSLARKSVESQQSQDAKAAAAIGQNQKADTEHPQKITDEKTATPFKLEHSYMGDSMVLVYPHDASFGVFYIKGKDAKKLYETLQLQPMKGEGNAAWAPANIKESHSLACYEETPLQDPKNITYGCSVYLNYRTGAVINHTSKEPSSADAKVAPLKEDYSGDVLKLVAVETENASSITIKGKDAKALYFTLESTEVPTTATETYKAGSEKHAENITCAQQARVSTSEDFDYTCTMLFDHATGIIR